MNKFVYSTTLLFLLVTSTVAQESREFWFGVLDLKVTKLRLELELIESPDGSYSGRAVSLDQGNAPMEIDSVEIIDGTMKIEMKKVKATYEGQLNDQGNKVTGTFTQFGRPTEMSFERRDISSIPKHTETWQGTMSAAGRDFEFQIRVFENTMGERSAVLDSFSENMMGLTLELENGDQFKFSLPAAAAKYVGEYSADRKTVEGKWMQGGGEYDLVLESVPLATTKNPKLNRPQTPKPPFEYSSDEFLVESKYDSSVKLAGTLTTPSGPGPFPVAILISGSGPQDRDCTIYEHKSFWIIADHFAKNGLAVIRYDERGIGRSEGDFGAATTRDFANDVNTLVEWIKTQDQLDTNNIILIGHSEGGIVAPMVASERNDIGKAILLAGPTVTGEKIVMNQTRRIAQVSGAADEFLDVQDEVMENVIAAVINRKLTDEFIDSTIEKAVKKVGDSNGQQLTFPEAAKARIKIMDNDWFRFFLTHDPAESLVKMNCPALVIVGKKDLQVDPDLNIPVVEEIFNRRPEKNWEIVQLDNLNHLFQQSATGLPQEYPTLEESFSVQVLEKMVDWIKKN